LVSADEASLGERVAFLAVASGSSRFSAAQRERRHIHRIEREDVAVRLVPR
jgi:hypothetical protein